MANTCFRSYFYLILAIFQQRSLISASYVDLVSGHFKTPITDQLTSQHQISKIVENELHLDHISSELLPTPENLLINWPKTIPDNKCDSNQCCKDIKDLSFANDFSFLFKLVDASGTFRQSGRFIGDFISDGAFATCKRIPANYCKLNAGSKKGLIEVLTNNSVSIPLNLHQIYHCVPASCNVESLNEYLEFVNLRPKNRKSKIPLREFWEYSTCFDQSLWSQNYSTTEIVGYVFLGLWILFLAFNPIKKLEFLTLGSIFTNLMSTNQPKNTVKTLHGLRVISLVWVILGHVFLFLNYGYIRNVLEITRSFVQDNPNTIWIVNGTFSVDTFFTIGGFLTGYLFYKSEMFGKKYKKPLKVEMADNAQTIVLQDLSGQPMTIFEAFLAVLNRSLRLIPPIAVLNLITVVFFTHKGATTETEKAFLSFAGNLSMDTAETAETCKTQWWQSTFNLFSFVPEIGTCNAVLWYVSCDYWYFFIATFIALAMSKFSSKTVGSQIGYAIVVIGTVWRIILCFVMPYEFTYSYYINKHEKAQAAQTDPDIYGYWKDGYFRFWVRIAPYFVGFIYGMDLFQAKSKLSVVAEKQVSPVKRITKNFLMILALSALVYFPLPNYYELFWPEYIGILYDAVGRVLWAWTTASLIYNLELYKGIIYSFLSNDNWLLLSKLNFSTYLIHLWIITYTNQDLFEDQLYYNWETVGLIGLGMVVYSYGAGLVFYVLVEAPLAEVSKRLMGFLVSKL